jgi:hypothetical protein
MSQAIRVQENNIMQYADYKTEQEHAQEPGAFYFPLSVCS